MRRDAPRYFSVRWRRHVRRKSPRGARSNAPMCSIARNTFSEAASIVASSTAPLSTASRSLLPKRKSEGISWSRPAPLSARRRRASRS